MESRCINNGYNSSTCELKSNRGKACTDNELCDKFSPAIEHASIFDDDKWYWKSSMRLLISATNSLFRGEERKFCGSSKANEHCKSRNKMGHYHFIPRDVENVLSMLIYSRNYLKTVLPKSLEYGKGPKFLDCGCGVGNIVILAHFAGFDAYGVEYDPLTLTRGRRLLKQFDIDPKRLMKGDILEYSKYHEYDVLYGYCPMNNSEFEHKFEYKLRLDMKIGALICGLPYHIGCEKIDDQYVYFKRLVLNDGYGMSPAIKVKHETN